MDVIEQILTNEELFIAQLSFSLGKARKVMTPYQRRTLIRIFKQKGQLDQKEVEYLAKKLGMSEERVKNWFIYKLRKETRQLMTSEQYPLLHINWELLNFKRIQCTTLIPKCICNSSF